jgi:LysM repeat protein
LFVLLPLMLTASYGYAKKNKKAPQRAKYSHRAKQTQADLASLGVSQPGHGKSVSERIIKTAFTQLGRPYRYGGNSPDTGFDCAGFVQWTYAQNGISLPRSSGEQLGHGERISKDELRPGDIVIFRRYIGSARGTHAGIYLGNGKYIHSPRTGDSIRVDEAFDAHHGPRFIGARRVFHDPNAPAPARETMVAAAPAPAPAPAADAPDASEAAEAPVLSKKDRAKAALLAQAEQTGTTGQPSTKPQIHVIKSGDSFANIVTAYRVPLEKLLAANQLKNRDRLRKGQKLIIPGATAQAVAQAKAEQAKLAAKAPAYLGRPTTITAAVTHVVATGDMVSTIAKKYGVKTQDVLDANNLTDKTMLRLGQKLNIPGAAPVVTAQAPAPKIEEPVAPPPAKPVTESMVAQAKPASQPGQKPENWRLAGLPRQAAQEQEQAAKPAPQTAQAPSAPHPLPPQPPKPEPEASPAAPTPTFTASAPAPIAAVTLASSAPTAPLQPENVAAPAPQTVVEAQTQAPETKPAPEATAENVHIIKSGDSISGIAKKYGLKAQDIFDANKLTPKSVLQLGQKIQLPALALAEKAPVPEPAAPPAPVQKAETAAPTVKSESKPDAKPEGSPVAEAQAENIHIVKSGDSISGIAKKYGLNAQDIFDANKLTPKSMLRLGQKIQLPGKAPSAAPVLAEKAPVAEPATAAPVTTATQPQTAKPEPAAAPVHTAKAEPVKTQPEPLADPHPAAPPAPAPDSQTAQTAQAPAAAPDIQATHVVKSGDNFSTIAHQYGLKSQALLDANKLPPTRTLQIGDKLLVPKVTVENEYKAGKKGEKTEKRKTSRKSEEDE